MEGVISGTSWQKERIGRQEPVSEIRGERRCLRMASGGLRLDRTSALAATMYSSE
jgi:hypothetical protein